MVQHDDPSFPSPLLRDIPEEDARALAAAGAEQTYPAGSYIVRQGATGDALYTILHGSVRAVMTSADGAEATLTLLGAGDSFGELSLFDDAPRANDVIAVGRTRALVVSRAAFRAWLRDRPHCAEILLRSLSRRLRHTDQLLADFTFAPLRLRLARRLIDLAQTQAPHHNALRVKATQAELASMLAVSRESVNKELQTLAASGLIRTRRGGVEILNLAALRTYATGDDG